MQYYWLKKHNNTSIVSKATLNDVHPLPRPTADLRTDGAKRIRIANRLSRLEQSSIGETLGAWSKSKTGEGWGEGVNSGEKKLIIFFCGWSFDNKPFERLDCGEYDVLMFYDYKDHEIPLEIPHYDEYYLITWSMGVYIAYLLRDRLPEFKEKVAINGTPYPIHNMWGIPERTFDLTLKYVDTGLQGKFQRNLFKDESDYLKYLENPVAREIPEQSAELSALKDFISQSEVTYEKFYDRAIISSADKIVPTRNQINCWKGLAETVVIESGHFPFYSFGGWDEILKCRQILK